MKADPPAIFFSKKPALLVNIDGEPIWSPIKENDLKFAVNTNWDLFLHDPTKLYYLRNEESWLQASDVKGPWTAAVKLPESFEKLPADDNWKEVKDALPGKKLSADKLPQVFVSTAPAEMILLTGEPKYQPVAGTGLLWVSNTESDVFRMGQKGAVYFLVSGRWFSAADFTGPWTFATPKLPEDFQKIPLEHPRSRVLASVPGTQQAAEAVLLAQVPETARVKQEGAEGARGQVPGRAQVREGREDQGRARRQHRQEHHQGRRPLLHVLRGRLVHGQEPDRPLGGDGPRAGRDLRDPDQLARPQRHLRDRARTTTTSGPPSPPRRCTRA